MRTIIVATGNAGKLEEIRQILADLPVAIESFRDHWAPVVMIPETGETFLENAFQKAAWVYEKKQLWVLADDSGLEVDFLGGDPGVRSARYAGEQADDVLNNAKLLHNLEQCPAEKRTARFRCVIVLRMSEQNSIVAEGTCEGTIGFSPKGTGGFGYDPLFIPQGLRKSFAELDAETKNRISHRGKALQVLKKRLEDYLREV
jgi:XTP/dITP diphosphohydrolase